MANHEVFPVYITCFRKIANPSNFWERFAVNIFHPSLFLVFSDGVNKIACLVDKGNFPTPNSTVLVFVSDVWWPRWK